MYYTAVMRGRRYLIGRHLMAVTAMSVMTVFSGCGPGDGLTRVVVAGQVTLDGQAVEVGQIRFIPQHDTAGPVTIAPIVNGRYMCDQFGGVPVGEHRVEILIWDKDALVPSGPGGPPQPQWAPEKYNKDSELVATIDASLDMKATDWNLQGAVK